MMTRLRDLWAWVDDTAQAVWKWALDVGVWLLWGLGLVLAWVFLMAWFTGPQPVRVWHCGPASTVVPGPVDGAPIPQETVGKEKGDSGLVCWEEWKQP